MKKIKIYTKTTFERLLRDNGYYLQRSNGSHFMYRNDNLHRTITINKDLNKMVVRRLIKEYKLREE